MKEKLEELNSTEQEGDGDDEIDLPNLPINDWDEFEEVEENIRNNKHFKKAFVISYSFILFFFAIFSRNDSLWYS